MLFFEVNNAKFCIKTMIVMFYLMILNSASLKDAELIHKYSTKKFCHEFKLELFFFQCCGLFYYALFPFLGR